MPAKHLKPEVTSKPQPAEETAAANVPPAEITMLHQPAPTVPTSEPVGTPTPTPEVSTPAAISTPVANQAPVAAPQTVTSTPVQPTTAIAELEADTSIVTEESSTTKWVVIIVVLVLLIVAVAGGAFYYLTQYKFAPAKELVSPEASSSLTAPAASNSATQTPPVSESDDIQAISNDVNNTNLEGTDQELQQIEKEL